MLARQLYAHWNQLVFGGRLDADLPLTWNPRLLSTAGQVRAAARCPGPPGRKRCSRPQPRRPPKGTPQRPGALP
jgi:hypothetical protein